MKVNITRKIAAAVTLLALSAFAQTAQAQCLTAPYGQYPATVYVPTCNGTTGSITASGYAGEYSVLNVTAGVSYTFSSSVATDFLTISNEAGTTALASGVTPLVWTATVSGNVNFFTHTNASCGIAGVSRSRRVVCNSSMPVPACATNTFPANGATNVPVNPALNMTWPAVSGASGYRLYIGASAAAASLVSTVGTNSASVFGFALNTTYYWYVVPFNAGGLATGCISNATSFTTANAVSNDNCENAIAINALSGVESGSAIGATQSQPACSGTGASDIWYKVTTDFPGDFTFSVLPNSATVRAVLQVFSGNCGSLTSLQCVDTAAAGGIQSATITGAPANTTYYVRIYGYNGAAGTYNFIVTGSSLPVTMDKLQGKVNDRGLAQLNWKTLSEQNNKGFEIQRSTDGIDFRTVGFVGTKAPQGNSKEAINYNFTDADMVTGTAYYRLVQTDIDGRTAQSNIVRLSAAVAGRFELVAVPNPVKDKVSIRTYGDRGADAMVHITDLSGKVVRQLQVTADETDVDMSSVAQGIYLLKYTDANHTQTVKITKQ